MTGRLYGLGLGPGDPELLTLKAARLLDAVPVVAYFAKQGSASNARAIIADRLRPGVIELPMLYPVTTEIPRADPAYRAALDAFHDAAAATIAGHLEAGRDVAVASEGDALFYGSYMHLHLRLAHRYPTEVVPGITAMSGAWALAGLPIAQGDDVLTVLPGTLDEDTLAARLAGTEAAVIMKLGRNLPRVRAALARAGRLDQALYAERVGSPAQRVLRLVERDASPAPYFSLILVPGWAR
ncbi:precorrin-2 C(20)-methyltransferase [Falsiroseomonas sp.]|uniref:precorrin-2 C(20)-methyltransferase n=1 Tax=Falsiroseomonas sp. TaxID=2870721 RepID=UPI0027182848|nr:precorrin-2 C(20)-methyltransferase [Falsiroseomonas sp.]MDO9498712.1 precorrin-2 C(20)-methyltransferase [Falsiroseomonas sp.]